jgi:hypothetical protein
MQRGLWVFLFYTLIGPFIAALLAALYAPVAIWANLAPYTAGDHTPFDVGNLPDFQGIAQLMAQAGLTTFVWSPIPAGLTGIGVALIAMQRGSAHWAMAGAIGVAAFFVAYVVFPFDGGDQVTLFAFAAGLVAAAISIFLQRIRIFDPSRAI